MEFLDEIYDLYAKIESDRSRPLIDMYGKDDMGMVVKRVECLFDQTSDPYILSKERKNQRTEPIDPYWFSAYKPKNSIGTIDPYIIIDYTAKLI